VIAGVKYEFEFTIGNTVCKLNELLNKCPLQSENSLDIQNCHLKIVALGSKYSDIDYSCSKTMIVGGVTNLSEDDPEANKALDYIIEQMNNDKQITTDGYLINKIVVDLIFSQVVSGVLYSFKFNIADTDCKIGQTTNLTSCNMKLNMSDPSVLAFINYQVCAASVIYLNNNYSGLMYICEKLDETLPLVGGITQLPIDDTTANDALNFIINQINKDKTITTDFVVNVERVQSIESQVSIFILLIKKLK
jgi:hypothetical protein